MICVLSLEFSIKVHGLGIMVDGLLLKVLCLWLRV